MWRAQAEQMRSWLRLGALPTELHLSLQAGLIHVPVLARRVTPFDKQRLVEGFAELSAQSRHQRFFDHINQLTPQQLAYYTEVDGEQHAAWGLLDERQPQRPGVGVARYIRREHQPRIADVAITIADAYQGMGAGTLLYALLNRTAAYYQVQRFALDVLHENQSFIQRIVGWGGHVVGHERDVIRLEIPVYRRASEVPTDTAPGKVLQAVLKTL